MRLSGGSPPGVVVEGLVAGAPDPGARPVGRGGGVEDLGQTVHVDCFYCVHRKMESAFKYLDYEQNMKQVCLILVD